MRYNRNFKIGSLCTLKTFLLAFSFPGKEECTLKRNTLLAILITTMMLLGTVLISANSLAVTPARGQVTESYYYINGTTPISPASSGTVTDIYNYQGALVYSFTGASFTANLSYGNYTLNVHSNFVLVSGYGHAIVNTTNIQLTVNTSKISQIYYLPVVITQNTSVSVQGITTGSATVNFVSSSNKVFETKSVTNSTPVYVYLPSATTTMEVNYAGANFLYDVTGGAPISVNLSAGHHNLFGFVSSSNNSSISSVTAVVINNTAMSYVAVTYSSSQYNLFDSNWAGKTVLIESPGYAPVANDSIGTGGIFSPVLSPSTSPIYVNYTLSKNPQYLNVTATFNYNNATPIPLLPNASLGSLYWQIQFDGLNSAAVQVYMNSFFMNYTNSTFFLNGNNYGLTGMTVVNPATVTSTGAASVTGEVEANYYNSAVTVSNYKPTVNVKIYGAASVNEPGYLEYLYSFAYNNSLYDSSNGLGLASSSVSVSSYTSPIQVKPLSTSGFFTLSLTSVTSSTIPRFVNPNMVVYWSGINSSNYFLNSSLTNTVIVVPQNVSVSFNLSSVFYNPITGESNYLQSTFYWSVNGNNVSQSGSTYNASINFGNTLVNTVRINGTSVSNQKNYTTFTVYAYNGTPYANWTISYYGAIQYKGSNQSSTGVTQNIIVPQLKTVSLNAYNDSYSPYNSSLLIPNTAYHVPLTYQWNFTNFTSLSPNTTYQFPTPTFGNTTLSGNLSVMSITGGKSLVHFIVTVNDTTPPSPQITMLNETHVKNSTPLAGHPVFLNANKSTEPYGLTMNFSWRFLYANGTVINASASDSAAVQILAGGVNNSTWVEVQFNTLVNVVVSLNAGNGYAISYDNQTVTLAVGSPRLVVNSVTPVKKLSRDSTGELNVSVSNNGTTATSLYAIQILISGSVVASQTYSGAQYQLNVSQQRNLTFNWKPALSGNVTIQVEATQLNNTSYPAFFASYGGLTTAVEISPPSYTTPLIIVGIILVIVVIFVIYYRFSTRRIRGRAEKGGEAKPKVKLPGQSQKGLEKKK